MPLLLVVFRPSTAVLFSLTAKIHHSFTPPSSSSTNSSTISWRLYDSLSAKIITCWSFLHRFNIKGRFLTVDPFKAFTAASSPFNKRFLHHRSRLSQGSFLWACERPLAAALPFSHYPGQMCLTFFSSSSKHTFIITSTLDCELDCGSVPFSIITQGGSLHHQEQILLLLNPCCTCFLSSSTTISQVISWSFSQHHRQICKFFVPSLTVNAITALQFWLLESSTYFYTV